VDVHQPWEVAQKIGWSFLGKDFKSIKTLYGDLSRPEMTL